MEIKIENGLRKILLANIITLLIAAGTLVWNTAILYNRLDVVEDRQSSVLEVQADVLTEQNSQAGRINSLEQNEVQIRDRLDRLEDFHFNIEGDTDGASRSNRSLAGGSGSRRLPETQGQPEDQPPARPRGRPGPEDRQGR